MRLYAISLGLLSLAFAGLVLGQLQVAVFGQGLLLPMDAWYSGLVPYPALLLLQLVILAIQFESSRELWVGTGAVTLPRPALGRVRVGHRPRLLSDNGPCYVSGELAEYLPTHKIAHTRAAPYHPMTQCLKRPWNAR